MKARPILFSGNMVRALLDGRKTMTRRVVKAPESTFMVRQYSGVLWDLLRRDGVRLDTVKCRYGQPGDLLYVKETFSIPEVPYEQQNTDLLNYRATPWAQPGKWRPSIFMPRWASRITLEITDVRVERLNDISERDAEAEGCVKAMKYRDGHITVDSTCEEHGYYTFGFEGLWVQINGADSWAANPWVWVIEFKVHKTNVDDYIRQSGGC